MVTEIIVLWEIVRDQSENHVKTSSTCLRYQNILKHSIVLLCVVLLHRAKNVSLLIRFIQFKYQTFFILSLVNSKFLSSMFHKVPRARLSI